MRKMGAIPGVSKEDTCLHTVLFFTSGASLQGFPGWQRLLQKGKDDILNFSSVWVTVARLDHCHLSTEKK